MSRTKSNPKLMIEMISLYLEQTPPLVSAMKQSFEVKDWDLLHSVVHKIIPSFSIMGMSSDFEDMAKKIQEYAGVQDKESQANFSERIGAKPSGIVEISRMVIQVEKVCGRACKELEAEMIKLNRKIESLNIPAY